MSIFEIIELLAEYAPKFIAAGIDLAHLLSGAMDAIDTKTGKVDRTAYDELVAYCDAQIELAHRNARDAGA